MKVMRKRTWTENQLREAVKNARSFGQVLKFLGLKQAGGNHSQVRKYTKEYNIDTGHFKGRGWSKGLSGFKRPFIPLEKILIKGSTYQTFKLKNRLFIADLKPQFCEECGWAQKTSSGYLPLELDHINGDRYDHRLENLRILCPNCHSLKPTHRGRRI